MRNVAFTTMHISLQMRPLPGHTRGAVPGEDPSTTVGLMVLSCLHSVRFSPSCAWLMALPNILNDQHPHIWQTAP